MGHPGPSGCLNDGERSEEFHARSLAALESTRGLRDDALCLKPAQGYGSVFWIWANGLGPPSGCLNRHLAALDVRGRGVAGGERIPRRFASRNDKGKFRVSSFWFLVSGFWFLRAVLLGGLFLLLSVLWCGFWTSIWTSRGQ